jgi:hypothetical protein
MALDERVEIAALGHQLLLELLPSTVNHFEMTVRLELSDEVDHL